MLNCLYHVEGGTVPVAFELIRKPIRYCEVATRQEKRRSEVSKNEQMRAMIDTCRENQIPFQWVLADRWFSSSENMIHIKQTHHKDFVMGIKSNRLVALSEQDREQGRYTRIDQLPWTEQQTFTGWLKGVPFAVTLARQAFTNRGEHEGILYLVCSQLDMSYDAITTLYQKRWSVEVFHKSLKSNAALAKSPARTPTTQANHLFASIVAVFKLEQLKIGKKLNQFALKSKLYLKAIKSAFDELQVLRAA